MDTKKRERTAAAIAPRQDDGTAQPPPTKRAKTFGDLATPFAPRFTPQDVATIGNPRVPATLVGRDFHQAIRALGGGGATQVSTKFDLNVKFGDKAPQNVPVQGDFSVFRQGTGLVQGSLQTPGYSAYKGTTDQRSVLPVDLSPERARLESRAIKQLSDSGPGYQASGKELRFDGLQLNQDGSIPKQTTLGGIALGSHLEDITALRAVGLDHVGSAIRAKTMTAKWKMKVEGNDNAGKGFRDDLLASFPQLGSDGVRAAGLKKTGISALKKHWDSGGTTFTKEMQVAKIREAHEAAHGAADAVFVSKFKALSENTPQTGTWWTSNAERLKSIFDDHGSDEQARVERAQRSFGTIRAEYRMRKLTRHGIDSG